MQTSETKAQFVNRDKWTRRYQRNNKRSGLKNLRCFPMCSETHKFRGFCGCAVSVRVSRSGEQLDSRPVHAWGEFVKVGLEGSFVVGDKVPLVKVLKDERSKENPFRKFVLGEPAGGEIVRGKSEILFDFNKKKRGWHYGWVANKHTCDSEHIMRIYLFELITATDLQCVEIIDSPSFTIFCRRRQRENLDRLPPQLKIQLEVMAKEKAMKKKESKTNKRKTAKKRKIKQEPITETMDELPPEKVTRVSRRTSQRKRTQKKFLDDVSDRSSVSPHSPTQTCGNQVDACCTDDFVYFDQVDDQHTDISDADMDFLPVQPEVNAEKLRAETDAKLWRVTYALLQIDHIKPTPKSVTTIDGAVVKLESGSERINSSVETPSNASVKKQNGTMEPSTELPDDFSNSIADCIDSFLPDLDFSSESGIFTEDTFNFDPLALDISDAELRFSKEFVVSELASYLVEERSFTELIANVFTKEMANVTPEQRKRSFLDILEKQVNFFLDKYTISLDDLVNLLSNALNSKPKKVPTNLEFDKHLSMYCTSPKPNTIEVFPSFPVSPKIDFTGTWFREEKTLKTLEKVRETIGVPWVLRQLFKQMESKFSIKHTVGFLEVQNTKKLLSSGYMLYKLDGKEHPWDMPPPVFTGRTVGISYRAWIKDEVFTLILNYSKRKRLVRKTRKGSNGNELLSEIVYQELEPGTIDTWNDVLCSTASAKRYVEKKQGATL